MGRQRVLLSELVDAVAGLVFGGFDLVLFAGGGDEAAHAVGLPLGGLHDLGERGAGWAGHQIEDLRALALGARLLFDLGGLVGGRGAFGVFLARRRALLWSGSFLRGGLLARALRARVGGSDRRRAWCAVRFVVRHIGFCTFLRCACA